MGKKIILLAAWLMLAGCHDDPPADKSAEAARIEKEVTRRVAVVEKDLKTRLVEMHTIRVIGFILLAGGAVAGLLWLRQSRFPNIPMQVGNRRERPPLWYDHYPPGEGRVIDSSAGNPAMPQPQPVQRQHPPPNPSHRQNHETARDP